MHDFMGAPLTVLRSEDPLFPPDGDPVPDLYFFVAVKVVNPLLPDITYRSEQNAFSRTPTIRKPMRLAPSSLPLGKTRLRQANGPESASLWNSFNLAQP